MLKKFLLLFFVIPSLFKAQDYGLTLAGYLDVNSAHSTGASDIWGWVDSQGNEYAIIGLNNGTSIVDVTDPSNPFEVFFEPGAVSIWRDIKTWNNHAYVTTEAKEGLLIIDLSTLPSNTNLTTTYYTPAGTDNGLDLSAHNLFIDENGYCYIFGANIGNKGCQIFDLSDPINPVKVGAIDNLYVHDGVAKRDTLFMAHVYDGFFSIYDVRDKSNPILLGTQNTPNNFAHNIWNSNDMKYVYTTDEVSGAFITEYDVSNPLDIKETDRIRTTTATDVIPHNTHFRNNFIITSYYRDGVLIHDVSQKGNMLEVARFDTSPSFSGNGFNGCWGVYPFLPSCNIIASDIEDGLFILKPDFSLNICSGLGVDNFDKKSVKIYPNPIIDEINFDGDITTNHKLTLYNLLGEIVFETYIYNFKITLPVSLSEGLYLAKISLDGNVVHTQRLQKK